MNQVPAAIWLDKTYDETMGLLVEAKHYHAHRFNQQTRHLEPSHRLELTRESLRITTRLSHTMAWLLSEKAIINEEIDRTKYTSENDPLDTVFICMDPENKVAHMCPKALQDLLERSLSLFTRAARLEGMLRQDVDKITRLQTLQ